MTDRSIADALAGLRDAPTGPQVGAFFDLDGTLVDGFTAGAFYTHRIRSRQVGAGELLRTAALVADTKFGGDQGRLGDLGVFGLRGQGEDDLAELGERLFVQRTAGTIRADARELVRAHRRLGHTLIIASSATRFQVDPIARDLGVDQVLCSQVEVADGLLTGRFVEGMLWGEAKARAVRRFARDNSIDLGASYAYGNGAEDVPFLATTARPAAVNPHPALRRVAVLQNWPVLRLRTNQGSGLRSLVGTAAAIGGLNLGLGAGLLIGRIRGNERLGADLATSLGFAAFLAAAGVRLDVSGSQNLWIERPAVFVMNHQSGLDAMVVGALLHDRFSGLGKQEARYSPTTYLMGRALDAVFIDRSDPAAARAQLAVLEERLRDGLSVFVAPEGTRSPTPVLGPFRTGAFHVAMNAGVPVVPVVLRNTYNLMPRIGQNHPARHGGGGGAAARLDPRLVGGHYQGRGGQRAQAVRAHPRRMARGDLMTATVGGVGEPGQAVLAGWGREPRMNDLEALMWRGERHPEFSSSGVVLEILDSVPDWERFRRAHEWGVAAVPRLRCRVVDPAVPVGPPAWSEDPDFDLDYHVRRLRLPEPAGERELLEAAQAIGETPFDHARPLWTGTLVELADGRAAYLLKAHHCLMDGAAAIALFSAMHSDRATSTPDKPVRFAEAPASVDARSLARQELTDDLRRVPTRSVSALRALRRALQAPSDTVEFVGSLRRVLSLPSGTTPSPADCEPDRPGLALRPARMPARHAQGGRPFCPRLAQRRLRRRAARRLAPLPRGARPPTWRHPDGDAGVGAATGGRAQRQSVRRRAARRPCQRTRPGRAHRRRARSRSHRALRTGPGRPRGFGTLSQPRAVSVVGSRVAGHPPRRPQRQQCPRVDDRRLRGRGPGRADVRPRPAAQRIDDDHVDLLRGHLLHRDQRRRRRVHRNRASVAVHARRPGRGAGPGTAAVPGRGMSTAAAGSAGRVERDEGWLPGTGGIALFRRDWLPDGGEAHAVCVLAHGGLEHSGRYDHLGARLAEDGIAVHAVDFRGHGRSSGRTGQIGRMSALVDDLDRLREYATKQHPSVPIFLLGHSLGAMVILEYLLTDRPRPVGAVLSGTGIDVSGIPAAQARVARLLSAVAPNLGLVALDSSGVSRDPLVVAAYDSDPLVFRGKVPVRTAAELLVSADRVTPQLPSITTPMLVLHGAADVVAAPAGARLVHSRVASPDKTLSIKDGLYHEIFNEPEGDDVITEVVAWIRARC